MVTIQHFNGTVNAPAGANSHYGSIKDTTGYNDGTNLDRKALNDLFIFTSRLMIDSGITPSNVNDTESVSQLMSALYTLLTNVQNAAVNIGAWQALTGSGPNWTASTPCEARLITIASSSLTSTYVEFNGLFEYNYTSGSSVITTLPLALRPTAIKYFQVPFKQPSTDVVIMASIAIDVVGDIVMLNSSTLLVGGYNTYFVDLSGVRIVIS